MRLVQAGERAPFEELVHRYRNPLLRFVRSKIGDAARAEDVVQEAFLAVYAARDSYNPQFAFRTWLWTIVLNLCRRHWRNRQRELDGLADLHAPARSVYGLSANATEPSGLDHLLQDEQRQRLRELLSELPETEADALRLRFFAELPFEAIAETMDSSVSGAKQRVRRGLERLAVRLRQIDRRESMPSPTLPGHSGDDHDDVR
ncbi:ECF RNA polymerase sigma-E factor [Maioricimonas rarisocia]|uniref:RNA polymerase sigma factor n=2 Tax=Maioricimonas rarisocia TaxID=2528026 RepID=A0A517Z0F6_9PLAN|nr:ECF RNA polymerase sigma-E factor [Maioricimonas rarisocia]